MKNGNKTVADRRQYVVKANDLIRKTRYDLTTQQQKIVLYCISKIRPNDLPETEYEIDIEELCNACGIDIDYYGGYYYKAIKENLKALTNRLWVQMPDNVEKTVSWIGDAEIAQLSGKVKITFHKEMAPYLFDLQQRYTQYHLEDVLVFKGKYSIRLYEILRSYITQREIEEGIEKDISFTIAELKEMLSIDGYPRWSEFDRNVIQRAVGEINLCNDEIHIEYEPYKNGGKNITKVNFIITSARARQMLYAHQEKRDRLNGRRKNRRTEKAAETISSSGGRDGSAREAAAETIRAGASDGSGMDQMQKEREELAEHMRKAEEMLKAFENRYSDINGAKDERDLAAEMRKQLEALKEMAARLDNTERILDGGKE